MDDDRAAALLGLRRLREEGSLPAARLLVDRLCEAAPDDDQWKMETAYQFLFEGAPDAAVAIMAPLARRPNFAGALECMLKSAEIHAERGNDAAAADMLSMAEARFPDYEGLATVRRNVARHTSGVDRRAVLDAIARLHAGPASLPALPMTTALALGYVRTAPDDLPIMLELGHLLQLSHRLADAITVFRHLGRIDGFGGQLESLIGLARACQTTGNPDGAWQTALDIRARFPAHSAFPVLVVELLARHDRAADAIRIVDTVYADLEPVHRSLAASSLAEAKAIAVFNTMAGRIMDVSGLARPASSVPYDHAGIVILTKDEADFLPHNLAHHYALGFRSFCVIDNQSTDATRDCIDRFREAHPDALVFSCQDPIAGHYQADKMNVFATLFVGYARIAGIRLDWMFFIDTDELIAHPRQADADMLRAAMADARHEIIVFHWLQCASAVPYRAMPMAASPFESFPIVRPSRPPASKVALRVSGGLMPTEGNHWATGFEGPADSVWIAADHGWFMFHFTIRSFEQLRSKVVNGGRAFLGTQGLETHGGHWKHRYERYLDEGDAFIERLLSEHVGSMAPGRSQPGP